jgi:hypothetical protein
LHSIIPCLVYWPSLPPTSFYLWAVSIKEFLFSFFFFFFRVIYLDFADTKKTNFFILW